MRTILILLFASITACSDTDKPTKVDSLVVGMDLSFQPQIADEGFVYRNASGESVEMLPFLSAKGVDIIRLRLWHSPTNGYSGLDEVLEYALKVKAVGMDILLDIHYSDTWADPETQTPPSAWNDLNFEEIKTEINSYTTYVLTALADQNTPPTIVQIGNEINQGFLWNTGRVGGEFENNWGNFRALLNEGIKAVRSVDASVKIMLHYAGVDGVNWFFAGVDELDFDIIGLSYYPIWHKVSLPALGQTLDFMAESYDRPIMIVETAYPFTLEWNDWTNNNWGEAGQLLSGYPATSEGQKQFFTDLKNIVADIPDDKGLGVCWWAPDWVAYRGKEATNGSTWENAAIFDFEGKALPIVDELN